MRKRYATVSRFHCTECNATTPLPRYSPRERGHIKDIWCFSCKKVTKHIEERHNDFFIGGKPMGICVECGDKTYFRNKYLCEECLRKALAEDRKEDEIALFTRTETEKTK